MKKMGMIALLALSLEGCMIPSSAPTTFSIGPYDQKSAAWSRRTGTATIEGQAVMRTRGGDAKSCAGTRAYLIPYSEYGAKRMKALYGNPYRSYISVQEWLLKPKIEFEPNDPAYHSDMRSQICDTQGNFRFEKIPDGNWWVQAEVTWEVAGIHQGATLMEMVTVEAGETKRVILTP